MKEGDIVWALVEATGELERLRAKLDVLMMMIDRADVEDLKSAIKYGYSNVLDRNVEISTKEIRDIFEWPACREVRKLREEYVKQQEEEGRARETASQKAELQEKRDKESEETSKQANPQTYQIGEQEEIREKDQEEDQAEDPEEDPGEDQEEDAEGGPDEEEEEDPIKEAARKILAAGSELSAEDKRRARNRKIAELHEGGLTGKEIAEEVGCSIGTVAVALKKWREQS